MTTRSKPADAQTEPGTDGPPLAGLDAAIFKDVQVDLEAKLGQVTLSIATLMGLRPGAVLELDARLNDLVELRLNQAVVARGEIVAVDDHFGVRITEIAKAT
ncbi:hypothetical protein DDF62_22065 [Caulobacter radicis]|uniref:FliM/FliN family flagellar motor switch protein n=1 Tax=Caulobacter radicis TaxID=2172650 RepID=UPI000D5883C3|nr:FliM/FliN family flagellar motor switch protein [Caulobacter radicis]PVM84424.1 hypothetical protein DDF62_22065 [Caulobacter radicis]